MSLEEKVEAWLRANTNLSWRRVPPDSPDIVIDRYFLNREEGYEIRDFIVSFIKKNRLQAIDKNIEIIYREIQNYKRSEIITRKEMWEYLIHKLLS